MVRRDLDEIPIRVKRSLLKVLLRPTLDTHRHGSADGKGVKRKVEEVKGAVKREVGEAKEGVKREVVEVEEGATRKAQEVEQATDAIAATTTAAAAVAAAAVAIAGSCVGSGVGSAGGFEAAKRAYTRHVSKLEMALSAEEAKSRPTLTLP